MNLYDMIVRGDKNVEHTGEVSVVKVDRHGSTWRGVRFAAGDTLRIHDVRRFAGLRPWPSHCNWHVSTPDGMRLLVQFVEHGSDRELSSSTSYGQFEIVHLPWPRRSDVKLDLLLSALGPGDGWIFLAVHRVLSRRWLIDLCSGRGVEIGPGPEPQVLPKEGVDVSYVEEMAPEEWNRLYNRGGKFRVRPELWSNYIIGEACNLPVADETLNFIFSSHVFEHLVNPIGHLERWRKKLKPGGHVICVVPDYNCTKDVFQERTYLDEWLDEAQRAIWRPTERHYLRHLRLKSIDKKATAMIERSESIYVHYYDNINCQILLDYAIRELGYTKYIIEHSPNHKDFYFVLYG
jgi:SAM-dependent methyltransferase